MVSSAALVIVLFVLLSGAPASILRAAVMAGLVLVAEKIGRPAKSLNLLIIAASVLALFEPKIIFDIGFQLSVIATYGLIRLTPQLTHWLAKLPLPKALVSVLAETLAATIVTAPILIIYFERLSLGSPLVNLLVVPLVPLVMGLGLIGGLALFALPAIGVLLTWLTWPILEWILRVTHYFASLAFVARDVHWPLGVGLAVTAGLILCVELGFWQYWQTQKRLEQE
jgi:competence protein ComEC